MNTGRPLSYRHGFNLAALLLVCGLASAESLRLAARDESNRDPTFLSFRDKLVQSARKRDSRFVLASLDPNIKNGFGEGDEDARRRFGEIWRPSSRQSHLYPLLIQLLALGAVRAEEENTFVAPSLFRLFPPDLDPYEHVIAISSSVPIYAAATRTAKIIFTANHHILKRGPRGEVGPAGWTEVVTPDGRTGFTRTSRVYHPVGTRIHFEKKDGRWWITGLLAGD